MSPILDTFDEVPTNGHSFVETNKIHENLKSLTNHHIPRSPKLFNRSTMWPLLSLLGDQLVPQTTSQIVWFLYLLIHSKSHSIDQYLTFQSLHQPYRSYVHRTYQTKTKDESNSNQIWKKAMDKELIALWKNQTWELIAFLEQKKVGQMQMGIPNKINIKH